MEVFSFCGGGIAVFENDGDFKKAMVVDMVNIKSFESTYEWIQ